MPHGAGHVRTRLRTCPVYFSTRDNLPGHLAICENNIIIMCIGLVHDIFTRNRPIYYGIDRTIDNQRIKKYNAIFDIQKLVYHRQTIKFH